MSITSALEFNKICRTCLSSSGDLISMFNTCSGTTKMRFVELLMSFTSLNYNENDGLPTQICDSCTGELLRIHTFQLKCMETDELLRNCVNNDTNHFGEQITDSDLPMYAEYIIEFDQTDDLGDQIEESDETVLNLHPELGQNLDNANNVTKSVNEDPLSFTNIDQSLLIRKKIDFKTKSTIKQISVTTSDTSLTESDSSNNVEKLYSCTQCDCSFTNQRHLKRHMRTHPGEKRYSCTVCNSTFTRRNNLTAHMLLHKEKQFMCSVCGKRTHYKQDLAKHMRVHDGERPYSCTVCKKTFKYSHQLAPHLRMHAGEKPYSCTVCHSSFQSLTILNRHIQRHTGDKPHSCTYCDKSFARLAMLTVHLRTHTGEKPYSCTYCDMTYSQKVSVREHEKIHTGGQGYSCDVCNRTFTYKTSLTVHMRKHSGAEPYACTVCGSSFFDKKHLIIHKHSHMLVKSTDN